MRTSITIVILVVIVGVIGGGIYYAQNNQPGATDTAEATDASPSPAVTDENDAETTNADDAQAPPDMRYWSVPAWVG